MGSAQDGRDVLDVIALVRRGAVREAAGGVLLLAAVAIGLSVWILFAKPFWDLSWRIPIPSGVLGILGIVVGLWFGLLGINLLRRTK